MQKQEKKFVAVSDQNPIDRVLLAIIPVYNSNLNGPKDLPDDDVLHIVEHDGDYCLAFENGKTEYFKINKTFADFVQARSQIIGVSVITFMHNPLERTSIIHVLSRDLATTTNYFF